MEQPRALDGLVSSDAAEQLRRLRAEIEARVEAVIDVMLFGSRARGDARRGSDFDVAIVVDDLALHDTTLRTVSSIALRFIRNGYHFRPILIDRATLLDQMNYPLARNIAADAISIR